MISVRIEIDRKWANKIKKSREREKERRDDKGAARGYMLYIIVSIYVFDV